MSKIISLWNDFSTTKKLTLVGVALATVAAFALMIAGSSQPRMALLYQGLDPTSAGEAMTALEAMDVKVEARGDAIYVPESRRDALRLALAGQGVPRQGQPGFELLDDINGYSTTSEMFDAAYWRAKEGELARTILATPGVKSARVHLGVPKSSAFSRLRRAPTASVTVTMAGGSLDMRKATAIRYLIALAVPELEPEQVAIIDSVRGIVLKPGAPAAADAGGFAFGPELEGGEAQTRMLEAKLVDLIEARVGPGNVRVSVALDFDTENETVSERLLDPESRVLVKRDATEISESGTNTSRTVTVASNLPEGDAGPGAPSTSERSETQETAEYRVSEITRERVKAAGGVARVNVAVLINEVEREGEEGELIVEPRTEEELTAIRDLVAASVGFDEARGDAVTVKSLKFHEDPLIAGVEETSGVAAFLERNLMGILQVVVPALVVIMLALFVVKPALTQSPAGAAVDQDEDDGGLLPLGGFPMATPELSSGFDDGGSLDAASPVDELRALTADHTETSAKVLKAWLGETGEAA